MNRQIGDRAVVLGASMAGLLPLGCSPTARAGDGVRPGRVPESPGTGVAPHGRHLHALARAGSSPRGSCSWSTRSWCQRGAAATCWPARAVLQRSPAPQAPRGWDYMRQDRPRGLRAGPGTGAPQRGLCDRCDIVGLDATPDGRRVTGARVLHRADGSAEEVLGADLVVDATGRGSRTPMWLEALGYARPPSAQVRIGLGYATRTYRLPADALGGDLAVLQAATPQHPRAGALQALDGDRWMLTLAGILGDHPPTDPDGFLAFARSLRFPDIHEAVRDAEPLDDPVAFRFPASVRHRYERRTASPTAAGAGRRGRSLNRLGKG